MYDLIDELSSVISGTEQHYGALNTGSLSTNNSEERSPPISTSLCQTDDGLETRSNVSSNKETFRVPLQCNRDLIYSLFSRRGGDLETYRFPSIPPERRGKRHRSSNFRRLNNFRHWWKTSRLLVRIAGALVFSFVIFEWDGVLRQLSKTNKRKGIKMAVKAMKKIGQGGMSRSFLKGVQPFTRTIRLYMAFMRGIEATVDSRFWEVLIAEAMAFMGNRSIRWWMRHIVDTSCKFYIFPFVMNFLPFPPDAADYAFKAVIIIMGFLRAILPFASSFLGSRIGRQTTFTAIDRLNFRWKTVQNVQDFVVQAGTFRPLAEDADMVWMARDVAKAIAHGDNPLEVRNGLERLGFHIIGTGAGGISVYRYALHNGGDTKFHLHVTPYGPSIVDEIPRYIVLEKLGMLQLDSSSKNNRPIVTGFTYSGCFFSPQEWAALKTRFDRELVSFDTACKYMGYKSNSAFAIKNFIPPPTDLVSLKSFVRSGRFPKKKKRDNARWAEVRKKWIIYLARYWI